AQPVLGSRATDTLSGVGPEALRVDDVLALDRQSLDAVAASPEPSTLPETEDGTTVLRFTLGPRDQWFDDDEVARLSDQLWAVTQDSNRVGLRLEPDPDDPDARPLKRSHQEELPSEGMVRGALQVPPAGSPVLFLNDHPVTGGYPVIGVVIDADLSAAAQLGPGERIRFRALERETADGDSAAPASFGERGSPASDGFSAPQDSRRKGRP
ncbi:MAG TPA: biotin-dependent carboxyltransferase family protein, partial [Candidatus Nesterenkonia stercoripullorum]|nr:biotin-dependent carboxyltransferase family protein [Candidatus Nesterenkonia stercoripullorum]